MTSPDLLLGDFHIHSVFSDDAVSTFTENMAAAEAAGLTEVRFIDHVRRSTDWIADFLREVHDIRVPETITLHTGVEAKLLDLHGTIDVPADLAGVDAIVIADHQFPAADGPWSPDTVRDRIAGGLAPSAALRQFVDASLAVMAEFGARHPGMTAQLAHWFSILPKSGLSEDDLSDEQLAEWACVAAETGTLIELNEKWACPGPRAIRAALDAGARVVAATDSHFFGGVGQYDRVRGILDEVGP